MTKTITNYAVRVSDGRLVELKDYLGDVLLVVNTASECGFTPQYAEIEELHQKYRKQGLRILAFPSNQFGGQEPRDDDDIHDFCQVNFGLSFRLMAKVDVNGDNADPFWEFLRKERTGLLGNKIKWNFTKFLINRKGQVVSRHGPTTKPLQLSKDIEKLLTEPI